MSPNIEIKARLHDVRETTRRAAAIADEGPIEIAQDDTFFRCDSGRLKLRRFSSGDGELIFYQRADQDGPKESFYQRTPLPNPDALRDTLALAYGVSGRVRKQRTLFLVGRTRIHVDRVDGLGDFLELEAVLQDEETAEDAEREVLELLNQFGIDASQLVSGGYVDLLHELPDGPPAPDPSKG